MFYRNPNNFTNTLYGMYNYDPTIFDNITIPDGLNKNTLITEIMAECGENEVLYPNIPLLKHMIQTFFDSHSYKYQKLFETMNYDYDPLENYNVTHKRTYTRTENGTDVRDTANDTVVDNSLNGTTTTENEVSAYDSASYSPSEKNTQTGETKSGGTQNITENTSNKHDYTITETEDSNDYGDNSARSAMYAIQEQRELVNFNLYKIIASDFENEITIPVYTKNRTDLFIGGLML